MFNTYFRIFCLLSDKDKFKFILIILFGIIFSLLEMISIASVIPIIQIVSNNNMSDSSTVAYLKNLLPISLTLKESIIFTMTLVIIFFFCKGVFGLFNEYYKQVFIKKIQDDLSSKLFSNYITSDQNKFVEFKFPEKIRNIGNIGFIVSFLESSFSIIIDCFFFLFVLLFLFNYNFYGTLIFASIFSFTAIIILLLTKRKINFYAKITNENTATQHANVLNVLSSLKEVKIFKRENLFIKNFDKCINLVTRSRQKNNIIRYLPRVLIEILSIIMIFSLVYFFMLRGELMANSLELITVYVICILKTGLSFNKLIVHYQNLNTSLVPANQVIEELNKIGSSGKSLIKENIQNNKKIKFTKNIKIKNLSFTYQQNSKIIFKDLSLDIKKNEIVGIYGQSGGGKTTLINLLLGFEKPSDGEILVDNVDLKNNLQNWYDLISYVPQDTFLFNDTIRKNILFGLDEQAIEPKVLAKSLKDSNLNEFIEKLPDGLETIVGEKAIKLSGGQAQRICIARALSTEPEIIILDEATSKLDERNEFEILENLTNKLAKTKTIIIISHRINTLKNFCDKVYRVKNQNIELEFKR